MTTLTTELSGLLSQSKLTDRQTAAVTVRLGWDGNGGSTLAKAAATVGYSRERVRQLERRVAERLSHTTPRVIRDAIALLEQIAPTTRAFAADALCDHGLTDRPFGINLIIAEDPEIVAPVAHDAVREITEAQVGGIKSDADMGIHKASPSPSASPRK